MLVECREVLVAVAAREDRRVDARVERLDAPAEHLRHFSEGLDAADAETLLLEVHGRAAAGHELHTQLGQAPCEHVQAGLVVDRDQRTLDQALSRTSISRAAAGSKRCSTA